jgi:Ca2+-binding RTX toxin-like protein
VDAQTAENGLFNGPLPPPNRFYVVDQSTGATSATPGDRFNGVTAGIISQNIHNSTSDNYFISALTPGVFISTDRGNDVLIASGGRNIFDGGSGRDTFVGASGQDTFIAGISTASSTDTLINFKSGDDLAVVGLTRADFNYSAKDTSVGLEIDATPKAPGAPSETIVLPGYTRSDLVGGGRFAVGIGSSNGVNFLFVHAN